MYEVGLPFKYTENEIPWDELKGLGITKEYADKRGWTEKIMNGEWTPLININGKHGNARVQGMACIGMTRNPQSWKPILDIHTYCSEQVLSVPFNGYRFDDTDKKNLLERDHMGRLAELKKTDKKGKVVETYLAYISLHPDTKEPVAMRANSLNLRDTLKDKLLSPSEKRGIDSGEFTPVTGMKGRTGEMKNVEVVVDAALRQLDFQFDGKRNPRRTYRKDNEKSQKETQQQGKNLEGNMKAETAAQAQTQAAAQKNDKDITQSGPKRKR